MVSISAPRRLIFKLPFNVVGSVGPITVPDSNNPLSGEFWVRAGLSSLWVLVLVLLVVVGGVGIGRAFGADQAISGVVKQVAKGVS
jgi:hypothetical protein